MLDHGTGEYNERYAAPSRFVFKFDSKSSKLISLFSSVYFLRAHFEHRHCHRRNSSPWSQLFDFTPRDTRRIGEERRWSASKGKKCLDFVFGAIDWWTFHIYHDVLPRRNKYCLGGRWSIAWCRSKCFGEHQDRRRMPSGCRRSCHNRSSAAFSCGWCPR